MAAPMSRGRNHGTPRRSKQPTAGTPPFRYRAKPALYGRTPGTQGGCGPASKGGHRERAKRLVRNGQHVVGVYWDSRNKRWRARVKRLHLGTYKTKVAAVERLLAYLSEDTVRVADASTEAETEVEGDNDIDNGERSDADSDKGAEDQEENGTEDEPAMEERAKGTSAAKAASKATTMLGRSAGLSSPATELMRTRKLEAPDKKGKQSKKAAHPPGAPQQASPLAASLHRSAHEVVALEQGLRTYKEHARAAYALCMKLQSEIEALQQTNDALRQNERRVREIDERCGRLRQGWRTRWPAGSGICETSSASWLGWKTRSRS